MAKVSDLPDGIFFGLTQSEEGNRLLLNFNYALKNEILDKSRLKSLLKAWATRVKNLNAKPHPSFVKYMNCLKFAYDDVLNDQKLSKISYPITLALNGDPIRVVNLAALLKSPYALLDETWFLGFPDYSAPGGWDDFRFHRLVESANGARDAIAKDSSGNGRPVRGQLPLSWVTSEDALNARVGDPSPSTDAAIQTRNAVAIDVGTGVHLYRLRYPAAGRRPRTSHRPTFAEALNNPYFKCRRSDDDPSAPSGETCDLTAMAAGRFEGLDEVLLDDEPMTEAFEWRYVGQVDKPGIATDHQKLARFLADPDEPAEAIRKALAAMNTYLLA